MRYMTEQELYHHGILGQKWGVRRFQNQDGSYTAAGRKRYDIGEDGKRSVKSYAIEYRDRAQNRGRVHRYKRNQNLDTMSDKDLKRLLERENTKKYIKNAQKNDTAEWIKQVAKESAKNFITSAAYSAGNQIGHHIVNVPVSLLAFTGKTAVGAAGAVGRTGLKVVGKGLETGIGLGGKIGEAGISVATNANAQRAFGNTVNFARNTGRAASGIAYNIDRSFTRGAGNVARGVGNAARSTSSAAGTAARNAGRYTAYQAGRAASAAGRTASGFARNVGAGYRSANNYAKGTMYEGGRRAASAMRGAGSAMRGAAANAYQSARRANAYGQSEMYRRKYGTYALPGQTSKVKYHGKGVWSY